MNSVIQQAIAYADHPLHGGAGYTLRVITNAGASLEIEVFKFEGRNQLSTLSNEPVFFAETGVCFVKVLW